MNDGAEGANGDSDPPDRSIAAKGIVQAPAEPDAHKAAQLVRKEDDPVKRAHIPQPVKMRDKTRGEGDRGQPQTAHHEAE